MSGVLDAFSAGILIYTGLVEVCYLLLLFCFRFRRRRRHFKETNHIVPSQLLAHDFLFNPAMIQHASNTELAFAVGSVMLGCGLMALLGRWA